MAGDAGTYAYIVPTPTTASATPAVSNLVTFVGTAVKGGFLVTEDADLIEAGAVYTVAGTTTAMIFKLQLCLDTQIANVTDILGVPIVNPTTGAVTAASASCTAPAAITPVGTILSKRYQSVRLHKGDFVLFNVTTAPVAAGGYFFAKVTPAGMTSLTSKLQGATTVSEVASTT